MTELIANIGFQSSLKRIRQLKNNGMFVWTIIITIIVSYYSNGTKIRLSKNSFYFKEGITKKLNFTSITFSELH